MQGWEGYLKHSICKKNKTKHDIYKAKHNKIKYACIKFFDSQLVPNSEDLWGRSNDPPSLQTSKGSVKGNLDTKLL